MKEAVWIMMSLDPDRVSGIITAGRLLYQILCAADACADDAMMACGQSWYHNLYRLMVRFCARQRPCKNGILDV